MKKTLFVIISALVLTSCSNQSQSVVITTEDSTVIDSLTNEMDSFELCSIDTIFVDSIN